MFEKILITVPLDSTQNQIAGLLKLAVNYGSDLHMLPVSKVPRQTWDPSLVRYVENTVESLRQDGTNIKIASIVSHSVIEISKYCENNNIDLVVTLSGIREKITPRVLGNAAGRLGITKRVPVLMVPSRQSVEPIQQSSLKILVPLDCTEVGESILPYVKKLINKPGNSISLLHINVPPAIAVPYIYQEVVAMSYNAGLNYLKKIYEQFINEGIDTHYEVIEGTPVKTIVNYARKNKFDLIAMGTHAPGRIQKMFFSDVTDKVSELSDIPVMAVGYRRSTVKMQNKTQRSKILVPHIWNGTIP